MIHLNVWLSAKNADQAGEVRRLLTAAAELSRLEPGCLRFELYQSRNDPAKFLLHERWDSQACARQTSNRRGIHNHLSTSNPAADRA